MPLYGHALMRALRNDDPRTVLCQVREVSQSGDYACIRRAPSRRAPGACAPGAGNRRRPQAYAPGLRPERLRAELKAEGFPAGVSRIKRLRRKLGIRCAQRRKFKATTHSNHDLPGVPNRLEPRFEARRPNETWVTDLSDVATHLGGEARGERRTQDLVRQALLRAVAAQRPASGLIHHSDHGSQDCARDDQHLLKKVGMKAPCRAGATAMTLR